MDLKEIVEEIVASQQLTHQRHLLEKALNQNVYTLPVTWSETFCCAEKLLNVICLPADEYGETRASDKDIQPACYNASLICSIMKKILEQDGHSTERNYEQLVPLLLTTCAPLLSSINLWSPARCNAISSKLIQCVLDELKVCTMKSFIDEKPRIFEDTFERIQKDLVGEAWKKSSRARFTFVYLILNAGGDVLTEYLDKVLPTVLTMTDDVVPRHAATSIKCIHHILKEVSAGELRHRGRINVLHDALLKKMHCQEATVYAPLLPCLLSSLQCVETEMMKNRGCSLPNYNRCFDEMLSIFNLSSDQNVKRIFATSLSTIVAQMGIEVIGHMKAILAVLEYGFDTCDLITVSYLSNMISELVNVAWLRMTSHTEQLTALLIKTLYSMKNDDWRTQNSTPSQITRTEDSIAEALTKLTVIDAELGVEILTLMEDEGRLNLQAFAEKLQRNMTV